jgi:hypothetical protein
MLSNEHIGRISMNRRYPEVKSHVHGILIKVRPLQTIVSMIADKCRTKVHVRERIGFIGWLSNSVPQG